MANITQTIPALTAGISQQPDEQKIPGQVRNMVNALPDVTQGLLKRPAGKYVTSLSDGSKNSTEYGKWFHYYRDETEQYIGQVQRNGTVRMWDCLTGGEKNVVNPNLSYLNHINDEDIQTLTLNDFTYINNRAVETEMDTNVTEPLGNFGKEIFVELKSISYAKQYALNLFSNTTTRSVTTATRIKVDLIKSSNNYCQTFNLNAPNALRNGFMVPHTSLGDYGGGRINNLGRCTANAGDGRDAFAPNVGTRIFNVGTSTNLVDTNAPGGIYAIAGNTTDRNYSYNVNIYGPNNFTLNYGGTRVGTGTPLTGRKNLYFRIKTTAQSVPYTEGTGTSQSTEYQARYTTTYDLLHGGEGWAEGDWFHVWMKDALYRVTIEQVSTSNAQANLALVRPSPTPFDTETTITAESILGDIRTGILNATDANGNLLNSFSNADITTIGTGLHIKSSTAFNGSTPVGELLNVVSGKVNDVGDLPTQCKHGMVVEVVNSEAEEDNHFVKFFGKLKEGGNPDNDADYLDGEGTWEECAKPGRKIKFNYSKMPVVLIRTANGEFRLTELDGSSYNITINGVTTSYDVPKWDNALVGDDVTNPEPSFIGKNINKMLFFRNRFAILSDEYIVLSRPGDFTNFWAKSAIQLIASDPIDISASSTYPAILYDGIQTNTGLVLFSKNQQFMLTTDSDVFSPLTAKINSLSTYNFNYSTNPISLGTTLGFLDNAGKFSRFFEMAQLQREGEPQIIEQSAVVSRLFEKDLKLISNSRENSVIFFSEEGTSTLYGYKYFDQITERKLASWFKWTLSGTIQYHCMQDDFLYVVVRNNSKDQLLKYAIKMDSNTASLAEHRVHLDHLQTSNGWSYNPSTNKSTRPRQLGSLGGLESTAYQLAAYDADATGNLGRYGEITINSSNQMELVGDWSNEGFYIGYQYTMEVEIPTIYYLTQSGTNWRADTRANTILHRVKFGFGPIGLYETTLKRTGRVDYTETFELTGADSYQANTSSTTNDNNLRTVPIYDRNINTNLFIKSTHPAPATIHNMTWEGVYNNNFYERV